MLNVNFSKFSIAPLFNYTDRHCRYFYSLFTKYIKMYTGMVHVNSFLKNYYNNKILPNFLRKNYVSIQFSGCNYLNLAKCSKIAEKIHFSEINFNTGCPSLKAKKGNFGAYLMLNKNVIIDCLNSIKDAVNLPVTLKHRIGLNKDSSYLNLLNFVGDISHYTKCNYFIIHACKGLSLVNKMKNMNYKYKYIYKLKKDLPYLNIIINGGIKGIYDSLNHLKYVDGVMLGRYIYHNPNFLFDVDLYYKKKLFNYKGNFKKKFKKNIIYKTAYLYNKRNNINLRMKNILRKIFFYIKLEIKNNINPKNIIRHLMCIFLNFSNASLVRKKLMFLTKEDFLNFKNYFDFEYFLFN